MFSRALHQFNLFVCFVLYFVLLFFFIAFACFSAELIQSYSPCSYYQSGAINEWVGRKINNR